MRGHWFSTFALLGVAAFAGGAVFAEAIRALAPVWLLVAVLLGVTGAALTHRLRARQRKGGPPSS
jgi:ABC-type transporter Mla maintaining outer membrane lipid asymmetry permease subunit MlaE